MRWLLLCLFPMPALADAVILTRALPARALLTAADVTVVDAEIPGALTDAGAVLGQETRIALRAGRPLTEQDISAPVIVGRNQTVTLHFRVGGLAIATEGRALTDAAIGQSASALNLTSHARVTGVVLPDGSILVGAKELP